MVPIYRKTPLINKNQRGRSNSRIPNLNAILESIRFPALLQPGWVAKFSHPEPFNELKAGLRPFDIINGTAIAYDIGELSAMTAVKMTACYRAWPTLKNTHYG
jgi:hypothetical protein